MPDKVKVWEGLFRETLAVGRNLMVVRFTFSKGAEVPPHRHPHEQSSYIVKGKLQYKVEGNELVLAEGDSCIIPPAAEHSVVALEDTIDINSFTPVRKDYC